ncbi:ribonuclease H-like domain-containing protein [Tanacetum coccineum]
MLLWVIEEDVGDELEPLFIPEIKLGGQGDFVPKLGHVWQLQGKQRQQGGDEAYLWPSNGLRIAIERYYIGENFGLLYVANAVAETCQLRNLLREFHCPLSSDTLVYYDNVSEVYLSCNLVQHQRTKHIKIDIYFVRDLVVVG